MLKYLFLFVATAFGLSAQATSEDSQSLTKQKILILAKQTTSLNPKPVEVRKQLDVLIEELTKGTAEVDPALWAQFAPGSWRQIWSDERDNSPPGSPSLDLENVYQFVLPTGRAVNFGTRLISDTVRVTFALEAVGSVSGNTQQTTILKGFARNSALLPGESLELLANDILGNSLVLFNYVKLPEFPKGPIGATSPLKIKYLDETLKIGTAPNAFTGETELFIVERVSSVN